MQERCDRSEKTVDGLVAEQCKIADDDIRREVTAFWRQVLIGEQFEGATRPTGRLYEFRNGIDPLRLDPIRSQRSDKPALATAYIQY